LNKIESISFEKESDQGQTRDERNIEYFIKPDIVIAENGLGRPKYELSSLLAPASNAEVDEPPLQIGMDQDKVPASDIRFSLHYNDLHSPIFAVGSAT